MNTNTVLDVSRLTSLVDSGAIDTVVVAMADMQGRVQGKRCDARYFLEDVVAHGVEGCDYLLAVDVDMRTVDGYALSSWEHGYGDFVMRPDLSTFRLLPWHPTTALCMADIEHLHGGPVAPSPRQILRRQLDRLTERGWWAPVGTELEFIVFNETYEEAWKQGYRELTPANQYNVDYSLLGTGRIEPLLHGIHTAMAGAAMAVESIKGECNYGQHEIAFRYTEALAKCDEHVVFKTGAKEIAAQQGCSLTFMAKVNEREGNSCHIHLSIRDTEGRPVFAGTDGARTSAVFAQFLAGQLDSLRELTLFLAPNVNSYKRFVAGSFAPTAVAWGWDNRTCAFRVVGHGDSLRIECRLPGGDVNPYLAVAALIAGGLHGIEHELDLQAEFAGNAYASDNPRVPGTLREAAESFENSALARAAFGDDVVDHYANMARIELEAFDATVTNWELFRGFERL